LILYLLRIDAYFKFKRPLKLFPIFIVTVKVRLFWTPFVEFSNFEKKKEKKNYRKSINFPVTLPVSGVNSTQANVSVPEKGSKHPYFIILIAFASANIF